MTTPGGVPNLPVGALTIDTLQSKTQDTSVAANRTRSGERVPGIFNASNGGSPLNDLTPFGVLTQLFSGFNSVVSQADPADINGPDDLPSLLMQFIEELPVVGQFVDLLAAFSGTYDGDDQTLLTIQHIVSLFIGADSPLNAANLYGQFGIPITWLNNNAAQALWNPGFDGPESIVGNKFQWDGTVYRTLSADHQPGSVRITADGAVHALRSNPYDLKAGDKLDDISVRVAWYGLSGTAGAKPMQISLLMLDDTGTQYVDIASAGMSDGVAASGWTGLPGGALGATLTGDWTATTDCTVVLRLVLDETAVDGTIWWDAASMPVIGNGIPTEWLNALVADFAKLQAPFKTIDTFFDNTQWAIAWEGFLDILGLAQVENQIIVNRNSIWTKLFQQVIPPSTLNLHPDMAAVNDELAIIFNPFDNNDLDRAQAWDDLMGLVGIESHTADSVAWWNNLFAANKTALANQSGVTDLADDTRRSINWMLGQLGFGYLNTSWVWVSGTPGAGDLPTSGWTNPGGAPPAWLADILKAIGVPVGNDLPSQLDPTIPAAPVLGWPVGGGSTTSTSVPQNTNLYYIATVVDTATLKESAPSNEVMIWSMPAIFGSKNQVTISWFTAPPAGKTISLYRRQSTTGQYRRVASGRTGTSYTDTDPTTTVTTQPGSAAATAATVINGQFTVVTDNHQSLTNAVVAGANGSVDGDADSAAAQDAVSGLGTSIANLQGQIDDINAGLTTPPGGVSITANPLGWKPGGGLGWSIAGTGSPLYDRGYRWTETGGGKYVIGIWGTPLSSDQQSVSVVLETLPAYPSGFSTVTYGGSNWVIIRSNAAGTQFVFIRLWKGYAQFGYWQSSAAHLVGSPFAIPMTPGQGYTVRCPDAANPYKFELVSNGTVLGSYTFTSGQAPYGSSYLYFGLGMASGTGLAGDEFIPGYVPSMGLTAKDVGVGAGLVPGVGMVVCRTSTAGSSIAASTLAGLPPKFFDDVLAQGAGVTQRTAGAEGFIVNDAGLYVLNCGLKLGTFTAGSIAYGIGFYTGVSIVNRAHVSSSPTIVGTAVVALEAGQAVGPMVNNGTASAITVVGEGTGTFSWLSIAKAA